MQRKPLEAIPLYEQLYKSTIASKESTLEQREKEFVRLVNLLNETAKQCLSSGNVTEAERLLSKADTVTAAPAEVAGDLTRDAMKLQTYNNIGIFFTRYGYIELFLLTYPMQHWETANIAEIFSPCAAVGEESWRTNSCNALKLVRSSKSDGKTSASAG